MRNELEDILYGLRHYPELMPSEARIKAVEDLYPELAEIWRSGHGVLSTPERIERLERLRYEQV